MLWSALYPLSCLCCAHTFKRVNEKYSSGINNYFLTESNTKDPNEQKVEHKMI